MKKIFIISVLALFASVLWAYGQTPEAELYMTWKASTYAPPLYAGKHLAIGNSDIEFAVDAFQGGKPLDLSRRTVRWYLENELFASGAGLTRAKIAAPSSGMVSVRADVPELGLVRTVSIRLVSPVAVAEAPFPAGQFQASNFVLAGIPYFFNVSDPSRLTYDWNINGNPPETSEQPDLLTINVIPGTADGFPIVLTLRIANPAAQFESASRNANFIYRK